MRVKIDCLSSRYLAQEAVANTISSIKVSKKNFTNDVLEHQLKCGISSNVDQHDIAIVGGGMVGIALACALSTPLWEGLMASRKVNQGSEQSFRPLCHFAKERSIVEKRSGTILVPRVHLTIQTPTGIGKGNQDNSPIEVHQIIRSLTYITREANTDTIIIVIIAINNPTCSPEELIVHFRFQNHGSLDNRASCH